MTSYAGLNLPSFQQSYVPPNTRYESVLVPSTNAPQWGGYFVFDYKEKATILHEIIIQLNATTISGTTGSVTNYPNYNSAFTFFQRIEIVMANNVIDTIYPSQQFILQNLLNADEQRVAINNSAGNYSSAAQRYLMSTNTVNTFYIPLHTFFNICHIPLLTQAHDIQIRIYMDSAVNSICVSTLTGTPLSTLTSANLICKVTRLAPTDNSTYLSNLAKMPNQFLFNELRYGNYQAATGISSTSIVLSTITGPISFLIFTCRPTNAVTKDTELQYQPITSFAYLDNASTNIVGGQQLPSALVLNQLSKDWVQSSYLTETVTGLINNYSNVYCYSFASDPINSLKHGIPSGNHRFTGNEQLQITFTASLGTPYQIDVYAFSEAIIEMTASTVRKVVQ